MAMNVQFLKGQSSKFKAEGFSPVSTTFYFLEDTKELYLGSKLLSNEVSAEQFAALEGRVKNLEDWRASLTELLKDNGANDLIKVTVATEAGAIKSVVVDDAVLDQKLADDLQAAKDYTDAEVLKITTGAGYATTKYVDDAVAGHETAVNTKFESYSTTEQMNAAIDADVKVVTDYIAENESKWLEKYDDTTLAGRVTAVEAVADAAQTAQEVSDAIDAKISTYNTELDLANKLNKVDSDAQGYASAAETNAKGYADQKLLDFENAYIKADENGTIDKLNEIAAWISDDEAGATKIISDVATNKANIQTINESAVMTSGITAAKVGEYDTIKNTVDTNKSIWDGVVNKLDASTYNTFVGTNYTTLDAAVAAANSHADSKDADIAKGVDAQGRVATLEGKVSTWDGKQDALTEAQLAAVNSGVTAGKVGQYDVAVGQAASALQPAALNPYSTTEQMNAAIATATTDMATNASVDAKIGVSASVENGPTGVYAAIQGATTNTVKDCVDSINAVTTQLTWGTF